MMIYVLCNDTLNIFKKLKKTNNVYEMFGMGLFVLVSEIKGGWVLTRDMPVATVSAQV